jgi:general secretion pathway protein D
VPWLGDLPYVGSLFRFRTQSQSRRELLVIMTPTVIRNSADSEKLLMQEARKMSWVLRDVDKIFGPGGSVKSGPAGDPRGAGGVVGPGGTICPPNEVHPTEAWVHPKPPVVPAPAATTPGTPVSAAPIPGTPVTPAAMPGTPVIPTSAELPPIPTPLPEPKAAGPALPSPVRAAGGATLAPGEAK